MKSECGKLLREIAVGAIASYGALAAKLGASDARDVTVAISANPIAVLLPGSSYFQEKTARSPDIAGVCVVSARCLNASKLALHVRK
jgi:6-O-methylguanine DNA methyltransferase, DNA binding domain